MLWSSVTIKLIVKSHLMNIAFSAWSPALIECTNDFHHIFCNHLQCFCTFTLFNGTCCILTLKKDGMARILRHTHIHLFLKVFMPWAVFWAKRSSIVLSTSAGIALPSAMVDHISVVDWCQSSLCVYRVHQLIYLSLVVSNFVTYHHGWE